MTIFEISILSGLTIMLCIVIGTGIIIFYYDSIAPRVSVPTWNDHPLVDNPSQGVFFNETPYNKRLEIYGSNVALNADTRWVIDIQVDKLVQDVGDASTGIALLGYNKNGNDQIFQLVYQSGKWATGYSPNISDNRLTYWEVFESLVSPVQHFELLISGDGKSITLKNDNGFQVSRTVDGRFFDGAQTIITNAQIGPQTKVTFSKLVVQQLKNNQITNLPNLPSDFQTPTAIATAIVEPTYVYHVAVDGNDAADGSLNRPFRTIQHCADLAYPGDECSIHAGIYRETVNIPRSGQPGKPIRFTNFNDESVTISGTDVITGWTKMDKYVIQAQMDWTLGPGKDQLFVDGMPFVEARHPNVAETQWLYPVANLSPLWPARTTTDVNPLMTDDDDRYRITSKAWQDFGENDLVGATYVGWNYWGWSAQTGVIDSSRPGEIHVNPDSVSKLWWCYHSNCVANWYPDNGRGYVSGAEKLFDSPGEFYRNPETNIVKIWLFDTAQHTIEAKHRPLAFDLRDRSYIQLIGLKIFAASLTMAGGSNNVIDRCQFEYISHFTRISDGRNGWIDPSSNNVSGDSTFLSNGLGGLYIGGHDNTVQNSVVRYSAGAGIILQGSHHLIHNNLIQECSYAGTYLSNIFITYDPAVDGNRRDDRGAHQITYNTLRESGRSLLHINGIGPGDSLDTVTVYDGLVIEHNHIFNGNLLSRDTGNVYAFGVTLGTEENPGNFSYNVIHDSWNTQFDVGLVYWDNGTWFINNHHNLLWGAPGSVQRDHSFNTGGEGRFWSNDNIWLPNHIGGEESLTNADFPGGRFSYGHNFNQFIATQTIPSVTPTQVITH